MRYLFLIILVIAQGCAFASSNEYNDREKLELNGTWPYPVYSSPPTSKPSYNSKNPPTKFPSRRPTRAFQRSPTERPSSQPTSQPTSAPSVHSMAPSSGPSRRPHQVRRPSATPSVVPLSVISSPPLPTSPVPTGAPSKPAGPYGVGWVHYFLQLFFLPSESPTPSAKGASK